MSKVSSYVKELCLQPHPEGGFYSETYRSKETLKVLEVGERSFSTAIYFLLTKGNFSAFHRIKSDEMWHFYDGDGLIIHEIDHNGKHIKHHLGLNLESGQRPQLVIPANSWFASEVVDSGEWCLVGCTVSPGFDFADFELAERDELLKIYPQNASVITTLTRT